ncbi:unnamed protein product [Arctia plantaginis]|uniref:Uncharacterized protein n=1 Tax=Arctia plantaginis TaxID=874455 RepID=A0A8S0YXH7_ARCPL|nr:unnamed protein product [Arctia plantaginis]
MPRSSRPRVQLSEEEKKARRREQKKMSMRRARAKLGAVALEERRRKDRERYHQKKQEGLIRTIKDFTPRQQRQMRKMWREKSRLKREKEKIRKRTEEMLNENTPPSSPCSASSRVALDAHSSPSSVPSPTLSHGTASASTVSGLRLPLSPLMCTPSPNRSDNATPKPFTPRKSFFLESNFCDESVYKSLSKLFARLFARVIRKRLLKNSVIQGYWVVHHYVHRS